LRVPALLICGTEDASFDAMARAARVGDLALVSLAGADHMDGFLSGQAPRLIDDSFATSAEPTVPTLATNAAAVVSVDTAPRHTGPGDSPSAARVVVAALGSPMACSFGCRLRHGRLPAGRAADIHAQG
jgi:hypothetical protein